MKKTLIIAGSVVVLGLFVIALARFATSEDTWICESGGWVKHGNPSAAMPVTGCGPAENAFNEVGHFAKDNPGLEPGIWYFVYEKPGAPALYVKLEFDNKSECVFNALKGDCPDVLLLSSSLTHVEGTRSGDTVHVVTAKTGGNY